MLFQHLAMEGEEVRERMQQQIHDLEVRAKVPRVGPGEVDLREVEKTSALLRFDAKVSVLQPVTQPVRGWG